MSFESTDEFTEITYSILINYLENQKRYPISIKNNYTVINFPSTNYHITIYQDQWDEYSSVTGLPYHLFHISSEDTEDRCSSYFWVRRSDNRIQAIPKKYFRYNQPNYNFYSSTRFPCKLKYIRFHLKSFSRILSKI